MHLSFYRKLNLITLILPLLYNAELQRWRTTFELRTISSEED